METVTGSLVVKDDRCEVSLDITLSRHNGGGVRLELAGDRQLLRYVHSRIADKCKLSDLYGPPTIQESGDALALNTSVIDALDWVVLLLNMPETVSLELPQSTIQRWIEEENRQERQLCLRDWQLEACRSVSECE